VSAGGVSASLDQRKAAIRAVLQRLAAAADEAGLTSTARDIRTTRLPKLDDERFSLVVLGEFNHGKSTFVNALIGQALLPTGITPTTAVLSHVSYGDVPAAHAVFETGERRPIDIAKLGAWLTVEGEAASSGQRAALHHVEIRVPAALLKDGVTIVDTPGVNDINQQRAEITYGYVPRADAAVFLLDATQILTASEREFLEERILRSSRDRLIFVVAKTDLLDEGELEETLRFAREHLARIVPAPDVFPVSAKRALHGDRAASGFDALDAHLGATLGADRRRLLLDHALADAGRLVGFVRQSLGMRRRSLELPDDELTQRIARAKQRLARGRQALDAAADTIRAETAGLRARVRQDLADFTRDFRAALAAEIDDADADDVKRYLASFVEDTWRAWVEAEGQRVAEELERLAEAVVEVASENARDVAKGVFGELAPSEARVEIQVDTFRYDASVFAVGALGTTVFLFVNTMAGGLLALATPILAVILRGRVALEIKAEAKQRAPEAVDRVAAVIGPKLDELIDGFAARLKEFIAQAGDELDRGISEVLDRALAERRSQESAVASGAGAAAIDRALADLKSIDEAIADIRQAVWTV